MMMYDTRRPGDELVPQIQISCAIICAKKCHFEIETYIHINGDHITPNAAISVCQTAKSRNLHSSYFTRRHCTFNITNPKLKFNPQVELSPYPNYDDDVDDDDDLLPGESSNEEIPLLKSHEDVFAGKSFPSRNSSQRKRTMQQQYQYPHYGFFPARLPPLITAQRPLQQDFYSYRRILQYSL